MSFGWKGLIPAGLLWIMVTGAAVTLPTLPRYHNWRAPVIILAGSIAVIALLLPLFTGAPRGVRRGEAREAL